MSIVPSSVTTSSALIEHLVESVVNPAVVGPAIDPAAAGGVSTPRIPLTRPSAHQFLCGPSSQASSTPSSGSPLTSLTSARPKPEKKLVALQTVVASPQVGYLCSFFRSTNFFLRRRVYPSQAALAWVLNVLLRSILVRPPPAC